MTLVIGTVQFTITRVQPRPVVDPAEQALSRRVVEQQLAAARQATLRHQLTHDHRFGT